MSSSNNPSNDTDMKDSQPWGQENGALTQVNSQPDNMTTTRTHDARLFTMMDFSNLEGKLCGIEKGVEKLLERDPVVPPANVNTSLIPVLWKRLTSIAGSTTSSMTTKMSLRSGSGSGPASKQINKLRREKQALADEYAQSKIDRTKLKQTIKSLHTKIEELSHSLEKSKFRAQKVEGLLAQKCHGENSDDDDVTAAFSNMFEMIRNLIHTHYNASSLTDAPTREESNKLYRKRLVNFHENNNSNPESFRLYCRGLVARLILKEWFVDTTTSIVGLHPDIGIPMCMFKQSLQNYLGDDKDVTREWSRSTAAAIYALNEDSKTLETPEGIQDLAMAIEDLLRPIFGGTEKNKPEAESLIMQICTEAFKVLLIFQKSKTQYAWVETTAPAPANKKVMGTLPDTYKYNEEILFGAVIKRVPQAGDSDMLTFLRPKYVMVKKGHEEQRGG